MWNSDSIRESRKAIADIEKKKESLFKKLEEYEKNDYENFLTLYGVVNYFDRIGWLIDIRNIKDPHFVVDLPV